MGRAHQSHRSSVNTFACSDVKIQMRPTCLGGVVATRSPRMSCVHSSNPYSADTGASISQEGHALVVDYKQKCQCPSVKIWPQGYVHLPQLPVCKLIDSEQEDVWMEQGVLRIHTPITVNKSRRICSVFPIIRMDDFISVYGEGMDDVSDHTKLSWPMVMVLCQPRENLEVKRSVSWDENAFKNQSRHFICGSHPPQKLPPPSILKNQIPGYSILLLGLDSVSHSAALRHLPKTMHMLETNPNAVTMQLYNVVGDGTTTNLLALLTGYFEDELPESRRSRVTSKHNTTVVDKYPWIWNTYSQVGGYATHFIEDSPKWGTFQYRLIGFGVEKTPTHSYGRPCMLAADKEHGKRLGCINSRQKVTAVERHSVTSIVFKKNTRSSFLIHQRRSKKYIRNALLIRLLKSLREPTTGFALPLRAHQVGAVPEFPSTLCSTWAVRGLSKYLQQPNE
ncbi:hypothetical protein CSKR_112750 [Clonorchis sinensis]|uniref:Uncharacterized protein n=1 Tax=Clonorchis sinensis TaxID=79923 RepID=A0A3R7FEL1_CLOSI|nr:hypothetical protein CSKR_112750 [Clonorchis sinensis]